MIGYIYKIIHKTDASVLPYIGSTKQTLSSRMSGHRTNFKRWEEGEKTFCTSFNLFKSYGVGNFIIIELSRYEVVDKQELLKYEQEWIDKIDCCNKLRAVALSHQEYRELNKDKIGEYEKKYRELNKEKFIEYREKNKEAISVYGKEYREKNKETIGLRTKKYRNQNKDKISERMKEYYQKNKDLIIEKREIYYQNNEDVILQKRKDYRNNNKEHITEKKKVRCECECGENVNKNDVARHRRTLKHCANMFQLLPQV